MQDNEIYYREEAVQDWFYDRIEYGTFDESTTKNLTWAWGVIDDMVPMYYDHRLNVFLYGPTEMRHAMFKAMEQFQSATGMTMAEATKADINKWTDDLTTEDLL